MPSRKLDLPFYRRDVLLVSRELLGKKLVTHMHGKLTAGIITETEAYNGTADRACHAYGGRRTPRTEVMYRPGGVAYVYLCYGIHSLFNVVAGAEGNPQAVLVRSISPVIGMDTMARRRQRAAGSKDFTTGPGKVSQALGIRCSFSGHSLGGTRIWIEDGPAPEDSDVLASARIGVDYAGPDAHLPYRFILKKLSLFEKAA